MFSTHFKQLNRQATKNEDVHGFHHTISLEEQDFETTGGAHTLLVQG